MIIQLNPPLPLDTIKGKGYAHFLLDYSIEEHLFWIVFMDDTGECWTFENPDIRIQNNPTIGRIYGKSIMRNNEERIKVPRKEGHEIRKEDGKRHES
jgi:hypothetical protein